MIIQDWARETGIDQSTISARLRMGWSAERTLETPTPKKPDFDRKTIVEYKGESLTVKELAEKTGHTVRRLATRLRKGWTVEEAVETVLGGKPTARKVVYRGNEVKLTDLIRQFGHEYTTVHGRLERGWSVEKAVETPPAKQQGGNYVNHPRPHTS